MTRQNSPVQLDNMPKIGIKASCPKCGRKNPVAARFCGGCGILANANHSIEPAKVTIENIKSEILARKQPDLIVENKEPQLDQTLTEQIEESFKANPEASQPGNILRMLCKVPLRWRKRLAIGLFIFLTCLIVIFLNGLIPSYQPSGARWLDFRAFLSRSFELTHTELDEILSESLKTQADPKQIITSQQAYQIETTLRSIFQKPDLSIFPNPFFEKAAVGANASEVPGNRKFADIPLSHPFYTALEPLLELGINFADKQNRARPYEPVTWNDWQNSVDAIFKLLMIEPELSNDIITERPGYMSNIDVRNYIEHLREKLFIKSSKQLVWSQDVFYPGRLEAFAVLASVIRELNANE